MVKIQCRKCTGIGTGKTEKDAYDNIDHAIGLGKGRPCPGKDTEYYVLEREVIKKPSKKQTAPPKK